VLPHTDALADDAGDSSIQSMSMTTPQGADEGTRAVSAIRRSSTWASNLANENGLLAKPKVCGVSITQRMACGNEEGTDSSGDDGPAMISRLLGRGRSALRHCRKMV